MSDGTAAARALAYAKRDIESAVDNLRRAMTVGHFRNTANLALLGCEEALRAWEQPTTRPPGEPGEGG
jgi:hypothetical protein